MNVLRFRILIGLAAFGLTSTALAQPAARSYSSYFFFGDSLTDNGNTFALTGSPPAPYFNGRVSNGITYAEYLRSGLAAHATAAPTVKTNLNFAFAGATAAAGSAVPNLGLQLGLYQLRGITAVPTDLFVVLAGANDLLNTIANPATQNAPGVTASAINASTAVANSVQSLAVLGARNILVLNLPDISKTARFVTGSGAPAASLAQTGSYAFNGDIKTRLAGLTLPAGTNVTLFDLGALFQGILANPARFGFTNTTQEYLGILLAGGSPGDVNNFVFWDGIHPTTKAHSIFAQVLTEVLNPEFVLGTAGVQGTAALTAADMSADAVASRLDLIRSADARQAAHGFVSYSYKDGAYDFSGYRNRFKYTASVVTAGFDAKPLSNIIAGIAVSVESLKANLRPAAGSFKLQGQDVSVYAQWKSGASFADVTGSWGSHDINSIARLTAFGGFLTEGKTQGDHLGASFRLGRVIGWDSIQFTPFIGLRYMKSRTDGYTETGVLPLNYEFGSQSAMGLDGMLGASADWQVRTGDMPLVVNVSALYRQDLSDGMRGLSGRLANTVSSRTTINVNDGLGKSFKLGLRVTGAVTKNWGWSAGYMAETRNDGDTASQYSLSLHSGF